MSDQEQSDHESDTNSVESNTNNNTTTIQQFVTTGNSNAKFPMLLRGEYEIWTMKMENWIKNTDHNLWNIVLKGNTKKKTTKDKNGNVIILPPKTQTENLAVQREHKVRTILLQALPDSHMGDFHHLDDAKEIWAAIKARFGDNEDSKKLRRSLLKQEFQEFSISEEEGVHKGYDRFMQILSGLNQVKAKPDNEDVNTKFLRALPSSWQGVCIAIKTKGGLDYMSFDELYSKLKNL